MNELSLFSGAGGGVLGSKILGWRTIGYVEINEKANANTAQRIRDGIFDDAPIYTNIKTFIDSGRCELFKGITDVVTGGFPCQDISVANSVNGIPAGIEGERSGLWKDMATVVGLVRPQYVLVENSPMLLARGLGTVLRDLASMGYHATWGVFRSSDFGFKHVRKRLWILAYTPSIGWNCLEEKQKIGCSFINKQNPQEPTFGSDHIPFYLDGVINNPMCGVLRNDYGLAEGMDRLRLIGNGQSPICMAYAFSKLSEGIIE